jgi:hypothetical protein
MVAARCFSRATTLADCSLVRPASSHAPLSISSAVAPSTPALVHASMAVGGSCTSSCANQALKAAVSHDATSSVFVAGGLASIAWGYTGVEQGGERCARQAVGFREGAPRSAAAPHDAACRRLRSDLPICVAEERTVRDRPCTRTVRLGCMYEYNGSVRARIGWCSSVGSTELSCSDRLPSDSQSLA